MENQDQGEAGRGHRAVLGVETKPSRELSAAPRVPHLHTDHCARDCDEEYERTDLEKIIAKGETWGSEIIAVHRIGEYAFVEYAHRDFSIGPNYDKPTGRNCFSGFINGHSLSTGWGSLDAALVGAVAYKRDGCNSQAGALFIKATTPRDGSDISPETRKHYYADAKPVTSEQKG